MGMEEDAKRAELLNRRRELLLQKKEQLQKTENVYRMDTNELIKAPAGLSGNEIVYRDDTENKGKEKGQFFGMQMVRGAASMFAALPQVYGTEQLISAEAYTQTYKDDFGFGDIVNAVNPFGNAFSRFASQDKILEKIGFDKSQNLSSMENYAQGARDIIDKNKKFLDESGLSKKDTDGIFYDVGSGGASLLTAIGMTMITKNPVAATAFFGELQKTGFYQEARDAGVNPDVARPLAYTAGTLEAGLEYIGGKVFLDAVANNSAVKRILVRTASESLQEGAQTTAEEVLASVSGVREKSTEEILTSIGYSALVGAIVSAPVNTTVDYIERKAIESGVDKLTAEQYAKRFGEAIPEMSAEVDSILQDESKALDGVDRKEAAKVMETFLDSVTESKAVEGEVVDGVNQQTLYQMSDDQLTALYQETKMSDKEKLVQVFGEDGAAQFIRLERAANSMFPDKADAAQAKLDEMTANLTKDQERLVYGIGDIGATAEDIKEIMDARNSVWEDATSQDALNEIIYASRSVDLENVFKVPESGGTTKEQASYIRIAAAINALQKNGVKAADIPELLFGAYRERGLDGYDAEYLVKGIADAYANTGRGGLKINAQQSSQMKSLPSPQQSQDPRFIDDSVAAYDAANKEDVFASLDQFIEKADPEKNTTLSDFSENALSGIAKYLEPISTTIRNIDQGLFYALRRFEMETKVAINKDAASLKPFLQKWRALSKQDRKRLDIAMKNTDTATQEIVAKELGILPELQTIRPMLDNIFNQAKAAGVDVEYRSDFIPRQIKNLDGLLSYLRKTEGWSVFNQAFENKENTLGRPLTKDEKSDIISSLLRGNKIGNVSLKDSGVFDQRTIETITPEIDKFYETTDQALINYIVTANEGIQRNVLFGKGESVEDSDIGKKVLELVDAGLISDKQARILKDAFNARFNRGQMGKITEAWKNIIYLETMGSNFGSTLRQLGDIGISAARFGMMNTAKGVVKAMRGNSVLDLKEIGIEKIAQEFESSSYTGRVLEKTFQLTGLDKMDRLGKRTVVNAAYSELKKQAESGNASLSKDLETIFGEGSEQVLKDITDGNVTADVKFVLFNKLLDMQPVALSEMPAAYLTSGNGRIFYTLKSFTIRQLDLYRRESVQKIRKGIATGDKKLAAEGVNNGMRLLFFSVAMNVGVDYAWDFLKNLPQIIAGEDYEPPVLEDKVIDNTIKAFGLNKYGFDQMTRAYMPDTPYDVLTATIAPPAKTINNMWKDYQSIQNGKLGNPKDLATLRSLPVGGELYYFWFGGGADKAKKTSDDSKYLVK